MGADRAGQDDFLEIPAEADQILHGLAVAHPQDVLFDDRSGVERLGHVMARGPDYLDSSLAGGVVRPRSREGRQKGVVDVDDPVRVRRDELRREDLHVAGEDDEVDPFPVQERELFRFDGVAVVLRDGQDPELHAESLGHGLEFRVVPDDHRDLDLPLPRADAREQVVETPRLLRDEDRHPRHRAGVTERPLGVVVFADELPQALGHLPVGHRDLGDVPGEPRVVVPDLRIHVLLVRQDPTSLVVDEVRQIRREPQPQRTVQQQYDERLLASHDPPIMPPRERAGSRPRMTDAMESFPSRASR